MSTSPRSCTHPKKFCSNPGEPDDDARPMESAPSTVTNASMEARITRFANRRIGSGTRLVENRSIGKMVRDGHAAVRKAR